MTRATLALSAALFGLISGCGPSNTRPEVEGDVMYRGKALGGQTLSLVSEGGEGDFFSQRIMLREDGSFSAEVPLPVKYKIVVEPSMAAQEGRKPADGQPKIPEKYRRAASSDLTWDIVPGKNEKHIELTD